MATLAALPLPLLCDLRQEAGRGDKVVSLGVGLWVILDILWLYYGYTMAVLWLYYGHTILWLCHAYYGYGVATR